MRRGSCGGAGEKILRMCRTLGCMIGNDVGAVHAPCGRHGILRRINDNGGPLLMGIPFLEEGLECQQRHRQNFVEIDSSRHGNASARSFP